jgi:hypothetical protein
MQGHCRLSRAPSHRMTQSRLSTSSHDWNASTMQTPQCTVTASSASAACSIHLLWLCCRQLLVRDCWPDAAVCSCNNTAQVMLDVTGLCNACSSSIVAYDKSSRSKLCAQDCVPNNVACSNAVQDGECAYACYAVHAGWGVHLVYES